MEIKINYNSKWGNSFLDSKLDYISSSKGLNQKNNYITKSISDTTILGILYRLIGARKPLNKIIEDDPSKPSFFKLKEENKISFQNDIIDNSGEIVFLRNKKNNNATGSFRGPLEYDAPQKFPEIAELFSLLLYDKRELISFIINDVKINKTDTLIYNINSIAENISKIKNNKELILSKDNINEEMFLKIKSKINLIFEKKLKVDEKSNLAFLAINKFANSLIDIETNDEKYKKILGKMIDKSNKLKGLSDKNFTEKDFYSVFSEGYKIGFGNPYFYQKKDNNKKNQDVYAKKMLNKENGRLIINIDCSREDGKYIKELIENAGVSSFYIGKKGLAYVEEIII